MLYNLDLKYQEKPYLEAYMNQISFKSAQQLERSQIMCLMKIVCSISNMSQGPNMIKLETGDSLK